MDLSRLDSFRQLTGQLGQSVCGKMLKPGTSRSVCRDSCALSSYQEKYSIYRTMLELAKTVLEKQETALYVLSSDSLGQHTSTSLETEKTDVKTSLFDFYVANFKERQSRARSIISKSDQALKRLEQAAVANEKATAKELEGDLRQLDKETDELADYIDQIKHLAGLLRDS